VVYTRWGGDARPRERATSRGWARGRRVRLGRAKERQGGGESVQWGEAAWQRNGWRGGGETGWREAAATPTREKSVHEREKGRRESKSSANT
jgi:hypothetical protein